MFQICYNISSQPAQLSSNQLRENRINLYYLTNPVGQFHLCRLALSQLVARRGFCMLHKGSAEMRKKQRYNYGTPGLPSAVRKQRNEMFRQGQLWCSSCEQFKPVKAFYREKSDRNNYGYRYHCRDCSKARNRSRKERLSELAKKRNRHLSEKWSDLAGGECHRCGYDEFYAGLSFHHIYPKGKEHNPATVIINSTTKTGYKKCWRELDKCCLLCMNCHLAYETGLWRAEFEKRDGLGWLVGDPLPLGDDRYNEQEPAYEQAEMMFDYSICKDFSEQLRMFERRVEYAAPISSVEHL